MVLLYVILSDIDSQSGDELFDDVNRSIELFHAMSKISVANKCADITREVLEIARRTVKERRQPASGPNDGHAPATVSRDLSVTMAAGIHDVSEATLDFHGGFDLDLAGADPFAGLVDCNFIDGFDFLDDVFANP